MSTENFLTVADVADLIRRSPSHVYALIRAGVLAAVDVRKPGAKRASWIVRKSALEAYLSGGPVVGSDGRALLSVVPDVQAVA